MPTLDCYFPRPIEANVLTVVIEQKNLLVLDFITYRNDLFSDLGVLADHVHSKWPDFMGSKRVNEETACGKMLLV